MYRLYSESQRGSSGRRARISYSDLTMQKVDENTPYTDRISVAALANGESLTVVDVQLMDERDFFCQVNGLAAGIAEGRTHLKVFSKSNSFLRDMSGCVYVNPSGVVILLPVNLDPPELPVIEAVDVGVSVTSELPSKVGTFGFRPFMRVRVV